MRQPSLVQLYGEPEVTVTVYGSPAPQGSKVGFRHHTTGRVTLRESSAGVGPWREAVKAAALRALLVPGARIGTVRLHRPPLDGPLAASMVFTLGPCPRKRPSWWPKGVRFARGTLRPPAGPPDLSKLLRSTEDALTDAGVWADDGRVTEYRHVAKRYQEEWPGPDVLDRPGAVIRIWRLLGQATPTRQEAPCAP